MGSKLGSALSTQHTSWQRGGTLQHLSTGSFRWMGGRGPGLSHLSPLLSLSPCRAFVACARPGPAHSHDWKQREQARLPAGPSRQRFSQQTFQSESGLPFPHRRKTWRWTSPTSVPFPFRSTITFLPCCVLTLAFSPHSSCCTFPHYFAGLGGCHPLGC